jgi:hypothetical protein
MVVQRWSEQPTWWQFAAWALCGASSALILAGAFTVGPLGIVPAAAFAVLAVRIGGANVSAVGALVGIGAWCFVLAWLNRHGPGDVCSTRSDGTFCQGEWDPWPFWSAGALFVLVPAVVFLSGRGRSESTPV